MHWTKTDSFFPFNIQIYTIAYLIFRFMCVCAFASVSVCISDAYYEMVNNRSKTIHTIQSAVHMKMQQNVNQKTRKKKKKSTGSKTKTKLYISTFRSAAERFHYIQSWFLSFFSIACTVFLWVCVMFLIPCVCCFFRVVFVLSTQSCVIHRYPCLLLLLLCFSFAADTYKIRLKVNSECCNIRSTCSAARRDCSNSIKFGFVV